jgi:alkylation response protein AidB-like acyl-CoA dehydrogenase
VPPPTTLADVLAVRPAGGPGPATPRRTADWLRACRDRGLLDLPLPGRGNTRGRYLALAALGTADLDLARLAEAHTDALAILADLGAATRTGIWGVWAANPPTDPVRAERTTDGWRLDGTKPWCSGAGVCDHALVTAQAEDGYRLFAVDLDGETAAAVPGGSFATTAMAGSGTGSVRFTAAPAEAVGAPEEYLRRPGFWHGAVGVAAVWWGGARAVARALAGADARRPLHAHAAAHAGAVDAALWAAEAAVLAAADCADADPGDAGGSARLVAMRTRAVVERSATEVLDRVGRALGAAPLAMDGEHARRVADLQLYLRQSHAERDLEELGRAGLDGGGSPWRDRGVPGAP